MLWLPTLLIMNLNGHRFIRKRAACCFGSTVSEERTHLKKRKEGEQRGAEGSENLLTRKMGAQKVFGLSVSTFLGRPFSHFLGLFVFVAIKRLPIRFPMLSVC